MNEHLRAHPRQLIQIEVNLTYLNDLPKTVLTRDISEGGLFLLVDNPSRYILGELVNMRYKDPLHNNQPVDKDAAIVRLTGKGFAVSFIEMDAF